MARSYTHLLYHFVFSTKNREPWLGTELRLRLYPYLGGAIRSEGGIALAINGMPDHVHILARLKQDKAISDVMRDIKANSSGWIHKTFLDQAGFAWQGGYGAFTVSPSQVPKVSNYIANQEEHHRRLSFEDEFVGFLKAHGIEYDERYLWE